MYTNDVKANYTKEIVTFVEVELDFCPLSFGQGFCQAIGSPCYQTFQTCKNLGDGAGTDFGYTGDNGVNAGGTRQTKKYRFFMPNQQLEYTDGFPDVTYSGLVSINDVPTKIDRKKGLGRRQSVTAKFRDFTDNDSDTDPYFTQRNYDTTQGSFWGKLVARNSQAYYGRPFRVYKGIKKDVFDLADFEVQEYVIQQIDRDAKGNVSLKANDVLQVLNDVRLPEPSKGKLYADYNADHTSHLDVIDDGNFQQLLEPLLNLNGDAEMVLNTNYDTFKPENVRIGSEIIEFTRARRHIVSGTDETIILENIIRGSRGTEIDDLSQDDEVQICLTYTDNPVQVIYDLLEPYVGEFITYSEGAAPGTISDQVDWEFQRFTYLNTAQSENVISKPTKLYEITADLAYNFASYLWWDDRRQQVRFKSLAPPLTPDGVKIFTDENEIVMETVDTTNDLKTQATQIHVYFNRVDFTEDKKESNYFNLLVFVDTNAESEFSYDRSKAEIIFADNLVADTDAIDLGERMLQLLCKGDVTHKFTVASENADTWTGDYVAIDTFDNQTVTGANDVRQLEVLSAKYNKDDTITFEASASFLNVFGDVKFFSWATEGGEQVGGALPIASWADADGDLVEADGVTKQLDENGDPIRGYTWF